MLALLGSTTGFLLVVAGAFALVLLAQAIWPASRHCAQPLRRWPANLCLYVLDFLVGSAIGQLAFAYALSQQLPQGSALLAAHYAQAPLTVILVSLLALDVWQYAFHRAMHRVPLLWRIHRVHHSDRHYDLTTGLRFHPLEGVLNALWRLAPIYGLGMPWEALVIYSLVLSWVNFFTHANLHLPAWLDRGLRWITVTPAMHRVHHALHADDSQQNLSTLFSVWDRLFGSYRVRASDGTEVPDTGVEAIPDTHSRGILQLLGMPFARRGDAASR